MALRDIMSTNPATTNCRPGPVPRESYSSLQVRPQTTPHNALPASEVRRSSIVSAVIGQVLQLERTDRQRERERDTETETEREIEKRERERERAREREREQEREIERERERERERASENSQTDEAR